MRVCTPSLLRFEAQFCKGAGLASLKDDEDVWEKIDSLNLYNPLALLAALPAVEERYLAATGVIVRSATHKIIGISEGEGSGVQPHRLSELRRLIYTCFFSGSVANASEFEPREAAETPTVPLHTEAAPTGAEADGASWSYDPMQSFDALGDMLNTKAASGAAAAGRWEEDLL